MNLKELIFGGGVKDAGGNGGAYRDSIYPSRTSSAA